jgi:hypothetical protein
MPSLISTQLTPEQQQQQHLLVHRCRFIEYNASAINAMCFTPPSSKYKYLCIARESGDLELWNVKSQGWYCESVSFFLFYIKKIVFFIKQCCRIVKTMLTH